MVRRVGVHGRSRSSPFAPAWHIFPAGQFVFSAYAPSGSTPHTSSLTAVALQPSGEVSATIRLEVNRDTVARLRAWARPWPHGWCPTTAPACGPPARVAEVADGDPQLWATTLSDELFELDYGRSYPRFTPSTTGSEAASGV